MRRAQDGLVVDILVLNAAAFSGEQTVLESGPDSVWAAYETNVRGPLDMIQSFTQQGDGRPKVSCLLHVLLSAL